MLFNPDIEVQVLPTSTGNLAVQWSNISIPSGCTLRLCVSEFPGSEGKQVSTNLGSSGYLVDTETSIRHRDRIPAYYFELISASGILLEKSQAFSLSFRPDTAYLSYIIAAEKALERIDGVNGFALIMRRNGERCPDCWNFIESKRMKDSCDTCYGTGWEGGYWDPIPITFRYLRIPTVGQLTIEPAPNYDALYQIQMVYHPSLLEGDVIVNGHNGDRYRVHTVELVTYRSSFPVFQNVVVVRVPVLDSLYSFPIPRELFKKHKPLKAAPVVM